MKSDAEIKDTLFEILKGSNLHREVLSRGGDIYVDARPANSGKEDITILVLDGLVGSDLQEFVLNINCYIPDVRRGNQMVADNSRIRRLSRLAINLLEDYTVSDYRFHIEKQPVFKVNGADEHCVNTRLLVTYLK